MNFTKYIFFTIIFYFLAVTQSSFLAYFNVFGFVPNLVFILFFLLTFFNKNKNMFDNLFFTVLAGFFLDVFNNSFLGSSIILLAIIYFVVAKLLSNLKSSSEEYPLAYFIPIFTISLIIYQIFLVLLLYFQSKMQVFSFSWFFIIDLIYNLIFSLIGYYIFKKIFGKNDRQLSLNI